MENNVYPIFTRGRGRTNNKRLYMTKQTVQTEIALMNIY